MSFLSWYIIATICVLGFMGIIWRPSNAINSLMKFVLLVMTGGWIVVLGGMLGYIIKV